MTVGEWFELVAAWKAAGPRTVDLYQQVWTLHLQPTFGPLVLTNMSPVHVRRWYAERQPFCDVVHVPLVGSEPDVNGNIPSPRGDGIAHVYPDGVFDFDRKKNADIVALTRVLNPDWSFKKALRQLWSKGLKAGLDLAMPKRHDSKAFSQWRELDTASEGARGDLCEPTGTLRSAG